MVWELARAGHRILLMVSTMPSRWHIFQGEEPTTIHDGIVVPTDAWLGVEGRPQSASGQTTILTGVNVPAQLGYHKQGFPNAAMLEIFATIRSFLQLTRAGV